MAGAARGNTGGRNPPVAGRRGWDSLPLRSELEGAGNLSDNPFIAGKGEISNDSTSLHSASPLRGYINDPTQAKSVNTTQIPI